MENKSNTFLFYLGHPAHYHNVSLVIEQLSEKGYHIVLVARAKDVLFDLLEGLPYEIIYLKARKGTSKFSLVKAVLIREFVFARLALKYKPKILVGTDIVIAHIGYLFGIPSIILNEDDAAEVPFLARFGFKYATKVLSPNCCDISPYNFKKIAYNGYHELAYLHPRYFRPDKSKIPGLLKGDGKYFVLRFAELTAHHDEGKKGINFEIAKKLISQLEPFGRVFISSERKLSIELEKYRIIIDPKNMHHALYFANMYIGDSQTMAAEAAVLGTPSLRFNDFVGKLSYLEELEKEYGLTYGYRTDQEEDLYLKVGELIKMHNLSDTFFRRKERMIEACEDVVQFWSNCFIANKKL